MILLILANHGSVVRRFAAGMFAILGLKGNRLPLLNHSDLPMSISPKPALDSSSKMPYEGSMMPTWSTTPAATSSSTIWPIMMGLALGTNA